MGLDDRLASSTTPPIAFMNENKENGLRAKVKAKTKKVLHIDSSSDNDSLYEEALEELNESPAFNPTKFLNKARIGQTGVAAKVLQGLQSTAGAIVHPKSGIKSQATRKTAGSLAKSRPYLSRKADLEFLQAHEDLIHAKHFTKQTDNGEQDAKMETINNCAEHIADMERTRQSMRVGWVTARHVQRVKVVDAIPPPPFPDEDFFTKKDDCGYPVFQWGKWIAYKLILGSHSFTAQYIDDFEELPFDFNTLRRHVERLIIVSAPLQEFISDIRLIYRWDDPIRTGKWLALYFCLWQISHIMTFIYGYIFYSTVMNHYYPRSVDDLREGIARSLDRRATAFKIDELMDKHGSDGWLEPLLNELGPYIQVQIGDLASFLEAAYNFYHFYSPAATAASLCFFAALFLLTAFVSSAYALKVFWFIAGLIFFGCWPIASRYPRYRLLVSPFKWVLWDVPTHPEMAFQFLHDRVNTARDAILSHDTLDEVDMRNGRDIQESWDESDDERASFVTSLEDKERDILSFGCTYLSFSGRFIISTSSIRFTPLSPIPAHRSFHKPYTDLVEMSKRQTRSSILSPSVEATTGMDKLELIFRGPKGEAGMHGMGENKDAETVFLENMRGRNKAFNAIVGFSGRRWQHSQKRP